MVGFAYDPRGGLASVTNMWSVNPTASVSYGYDPAGRLQTLTQGLAGTSADQIWGFTYNPAGQIVTRAGSNDAYSSNTAYPVERGYTVNGLNQYQTAGPATFEYDANGNLKSDCTNGYVYDAENRLVSASGPKPATLAYDPLGRLWQVTGSGSTTRFFYDGDRLISETDGSGNLLRAYAHGAGADTPLVWWELTPGAGAVRRFLHSDHQGSIVAVSDAATGNMMAINAYDPWGIPNPANQGRFGYTGQVWLPEIGLWYYKARVYSPTLGRFLQTDPVGYKDQVNLYAYVGNDPVDHTDPDGEELKPGQHVVVIVGGTKDQRAHYKQVVQRVLGTPRGQQLQRETIGPKGEPARTQKIELGRFGSNTGAVFNVDWLRRRTSTNTIQIDPNFHPIIQTTRGPTVASDDRIVGHELGHSITGTQDAGPRRMDNINQNENPIASALHLAPRTQYESPEGNKRH